MLEVVFLSYQTGTVEAGVCSGLSNRFLHFKLPLCTCHWYLPGGLAY